MFSTSASEWLSSNLLLPPSNVPTSLRLHDATNAQPRKQGNTTSVDGRGLRLLLCLLASQPRRGISKYPYAVQWCRVLSSPSGASLSRIDLIFHPPPHPSPTSIANTFAVSVRAPRCENVIGIGSTAGQFIVQRLAESSRSFDFSDLSSKCFCWHWRWRTVVSLLSKYRCMT